MNDYKNVGLYVPYYVIIKYITYHMFIYVNGDKNNISYYDY